MALGKNVMKIDSLWQIEGTLTTVTPMHIGDGGARTRPVRRGRTRAGSIEPPQEETEIQTAAKMLDGRGRIPAASLKGVVRGGFEHPDIDLFGTGDEKHERGGLAQFLDACTDEPLTWDSLILGRTAIDEITGAAQDRFLFHEEVVPEGTSFRVRIRGKTLPGAHWQHAVSILQQGLQRFNARTIRLGAGESNNRGICTWRLDAVRIMDEAARNEWVTKPEPLDIFFSRLADRKAELPKAGANHGPAVKSVRLLLRFDGHPFLVNDPGKTGKKEENKNAHAARRTPDGRLLLPAESFRGVLAHQAARIARTKNQNGAREPVQRDAAGNLPSGLRPVTRLFGSGGWGSVIGVSDFIETAPAGKPLPQQPYVQEFLAIDRFTGGGAEERKFDAEGGWAPVLDGVITVDLRRLKLTGRLESALGLLALTLRDLVEGDLAFGWGSSKGYGWATVDTEGKDAVAWIEQQFAGWADGTVADWIAAWESEGAKNG